LYTVVDCVKCHHVTWHARCKGPHVAGYSLGGGVAMQMAVRLGRFCSPRHHFISAINWLGRSTVISRSQERSPAGAGPGWWCWTPPLSGRRSRWSRASWSLGSPLTTWQGTRHRSCVYINACVNPAMIGSVILSRATDVCGVVSGDRTLWVIIGPHAWVNPVMVSHLIACYHWRCEPATSCTSYQTLVS